MSDIGGGKGSNSGQQLFGPSQFDMSALMDPQSTDVSALSGTSGGVVGSDGSNSLPATATSGGSTDPTAAMAKSLYTSGEAAMPSGNNFVASSSNPSGANPAASSALAMMNAGMAGGFDPNSAGRQTSPTGTVAGKGI